MTKVLSLVLICILVIMAFFGLTACTSKDEISVLKQEKEVLIQENLELIENNKIIIEMNVALKDSLEKTELKYKQLKEKSDDKKTITNELFYNLVMTRFSAQTRLSYDKNNDLEKVYKIHTEHSVKDGWYAINGDSFEIELIGYEYAKEVNFYYSKLETCMVHMPLAEDTNVEDGWLFKSDDINEIFIPQEASYTEWPATYVIYAEVILDNGDMEYPPVIPLYNILNASN